ncbi:MAG: crossover junction endodeoxyribonuclease RuvC [Clostridia bacterium]
MIILGFDPGLATIGYGVIEVIDKRTKAIDYGVITTPKEESTPVRLALIFKAANELIDKYKPEEIAMEELFFSQNITTGINVAQARGVLIVSSINKCGLLFEYTPLQVKMALTGYGRADKQQIQAMVKAYLGLEKIPKPDDAADALAVALTHSQSRNIKGRMM